VADAYLFTVLNWNIATPIDLKKWPAVEAYYARLKQRPSIARALSEEHALYAAELQRHKAA
jgi:glutathione S-transferase